MNCPIFKYERIIDKNKSYNYELLRNELRVTSSDFTFLALCRSHVEATYDSASMFVLSGLVTTIRADKVYGGDTFAPKLTVDGTTINVEFYNNNGGSISFLNVSF